MPLDRDHLTRASQITVPTYMVFFIANGLNYMTSSTNWLLPTPMLRYANSIMDIRVWGALFFSCGLLMLVAMWIHGRELYRFGLLVCAACMVVWAVLCIIGIRTEHVSFSAWTWPGAMFAFALATNRSLVRDRFQPNGA